MTNYTAQLHNIRSLVDNFEKVLLEDPKVVLMDPIDQALHDVPDLISRLHAIKDRLSNIETENLPKLGLD